MYDLQTSQEYIRSIRCENINSASFNWTYADASRYTRKSIIEEVDWRTSGAVTDIKNQVCAYSFLMKCTIIEDAGLSRGNGQN